MGKILTLVSIISLCLVFQFVDTEAKVVVLFSIPHAANVRTHTNVGRALTEMGHEAYVCIPHFMIKEKLVNVDGIKVIDYGESMGNIDNKIGGVMGKNVFEQGSPGITDMMAAFGIYQDTVKEILSDKVLRSKLKGLKPDLFVITSFPPAKSLVLLPYMLDVPFAYLSPFHDIVTQRVPFSPSATACPLMPGFKEHDSSILDRLKNVACIAAKVAFDVYFTDQTMMAKFAPHRPQIPINDLARKMEVYIVESDHILDYAKPKVPNTKLVGCTAPTPARPLKEPFKSFVDKAKNGVAVVTFGSIIVDLPNPVAQMMIKAFEQLNLQIVWRVNATSPNPNKILTSRWVPQNDILAHSNTKLFVSHCGANGQYEALYHGVPILCLPLFGDQLFNAQRSQAKEYGITVDLMEISDKELAKFMNQVAETPKYRNNIQKASKLFRELFKLPVNEAAYWIDHVMEYGGAYMRSASQDMPWYQYLCLDILALIAAVEIIVLLLIFSVCRSLFRRCVKSSASKSRDGKDKKE